MASILSPTPTQIKRNINLIETDFELPQWFYEKCVQEFKKVNLCKTDEKDVKRIVSPFLSNWGMMGRVIFDKERRGWEGKLAEIIRDKCEVFKELREKDLADDEVNLDKLKTVIKDSYEKIANLIAPVSASKVLHLICPKFFPMWDTKIRKAISEEAKKRNKSKIGLGTSATGYYKFVNKIWRLIEQNKPTLLELQQKYHRSLVRLCDEYLLWETRKGHASILGTLQNRKRGVASPLRKG